MKYFFLFILVSTLLSGCAMTSSYKTQKHQMEMSLHKVRTEVDEIKHDLNTYEIEHHILEGKLIDQNQIMATLKKQLAEITQDKIESFQQTLQKLERKITELSKKQDKISSDIRQLSAHANETTTALSQYKEKIAQFEKNLLKQKDQLQTLAHLRATLSKLSHESKQSIYIIQKGDTLEKIARDQQVDIEKIKKLNHLKSDLIVVGQKIYLP